MTTSRGSFESIEVFNFYHGVVYTLAAANKGMRWRIIQHLLLICIVASCWYEPGEWQLSAVLWLPRFHLCGGGKRESGDLISVRPKYQKEKSGLATPD